MWCLALFWKEEKNIQFKTWALGYLETPAEPCVSLLCREVALWVCVVLSPKTGVFLPIVLYAVVMLMGHAAEIHFGEFIWTKGHIHGNKKQYLVLDCALWHDGWTSWSLHTPATIAWLFTWCSSYNIKHIHFLFLLSTLLKWIRLNFLCLLEDICTFLTDQMVSKASKSQLSQSSLQSLLFWSFVAISVFNMLGLLLHPTGMACK